MRYINFMATHNSAKPFAAICFRSKILQSFPIYRIFLTVFLIVSSVCTNANEEIQDKIAAADFVFTGTVINVQNRLAETENEAGKKVPYTFVTYQVNRILKGNHQEQTLTLRFLGGITENDEIVTYEGQPYFDLGDQDLLMVKGNGLFPCPLVECSAGRYRFIDGQVVNEYGQKLYFSDDGNLILGETIESEAITTHQLSANMTLTQTQVNEVGVGETTKIDETYPDAFAPSPIDFQSTIEKQVDTLYSPEELQALAPVTSVDPDKPFKDESLRPHSGADAPTEPPREETEMAANEERQTTGHAPAVKPPSAGPPHSTPAADESVPSNTSNSLKASTINPQTLHVNNNNSSTMWLLATFLALVILAWLFIWKLSLGYTKAQK